MKFQDAKLKVRALGLNFSVANMNRVLPHNKHETDMHFLIKCLLVRHFTVKGETVFTEYEIGKGVFDVFNLDRLICYEIETDPSSTIYSEKRALLQGYQQRIDIIIVDPKKYSENLIEALSQIVKSIG